MQVPYFADLFFVPGPLAAEVTGVDLVWGADKPELHTLCDATGQTDGLAFVGQTHTHFC